MVTFPPDVLEIMIRGLSAEIERLEAIGAVCGDDWPDDYDPNDLAIYRGVRQWFEQHRSTGAELSEGFSSKPTRFVMAWLPYFVRTSAVSLSEAQVQAAARTYAQYVAHRCLEMLELQLERSSARQEITRLLQNLVSFPDDPRGRNGPAGV